MFKIVILSLFILNSLSLYGRNRAQNPTDRIHKNYGCPENSECSATSGRKIHNWKELFKYHQAKPQVMAKNIEKFRRKNGIPTLFLMEDTKEKKQLIDPVVWSSRCPNHNLKDKVKIVKALQFYKNAPKSKNLKLIPVFRGKVKYQLPYEDQPLLIWKNKLILVKEFEDVLFSISISKSGKWKVIDIPRRLLTKARLSKEKANCKTKSKADQYFLGSYCTDIWNEDTKKLEMIKQMWTCP